MYWIINHRRNFGHLSHSKMATAICSIAVFYSYGANTANTFLMSSVLYLVDYCVWKRKIIVEKYAAGITFIWFNSIFKIGRLLMKRVKKYLKLNLNYEKLRTKWFIFMLCIHKYILLYMRPIKEDSFTVFLLIIMRFQW